VSCSNGSSRPDGSGASTGGAAAPAPEAHNDLLGKLGALHAVLRRLGRAVVAFSGGTDSALVARVATDVLGPRQVLCVTAVSASLAPEERADCEKLAREWGLRWRTVHTHELDDPAYAVNDADRCYHCKASLLSSLGPIAVSESATVLLGVNLDDLRDHRPGQRAAHERGAEFPLVAAGFTKHDVRAVSRLLGLRTWDKPAAACLASRVPYGTPVTLSTLSTVAAAESALRALGFRQLRVRHYGDLARVELDPRDLERAVARRHDVVDAVRGAGYRYVTLDLEGFRSGNLNHGLDRAAEAAR
jgi:pyridinium-3,5-biscarboxylic acid mononucleotide sulfurtransferase